MEKMKFLIAITLVCISSINLAAQTSLVVKDVADPKEMLLLDILKLVIKKSGNEGNYQFDGRELVITEARLASMVRDGELSVMWAGIQQSYEEDLLPIRIPVLKGLLGHRIFIIRKGDQSKFDQVTTLEQLKQIPLGQGRFWGDTAILKHNNLNVVDPVKYQSLVYMLEGGRFDFFPRAVYEPWAEVKNFKELDLTVEKSILLIYPFGMYYYVKKGNEQLAADIRQGFENAWADGSYDELFFNHPMIRDALSNANLGARKVFRLENPFLPEKTPISEQKLWLDIESL